MVKQLRRQLEAAALPDGLDVYEVSSIAVPEDPDDYATPDLIVLPLEWEEDDDWLADVADAALVVEVISQSEKSRDIRDKADWYAVVRGACSLCHRSQEGHLGSAHPSGQRCLP